MESAINFGFGAALKSETTVAQGRITQQNFNDYEVLRIHEAPERIAVHVVPSTDAPGGCGEPGVPPIAPAVTNALFAATGKRIRRLPIRIEELRGQQARVKRPPAGYVFGKHCLRIRDTCP
jgi:isoquinoline 1-oxidoreductase subunit beta